MTDPALGKTRPSAEQLWLLSTEGRQGQDVVADVAVAVRAFDLYTYAVPEALVGQVRPGVRVRVPYGRSRRIVEGWCVRVSQSKWNHTRKPLSGVITPEPLLSESLVELALWISDYYACPPAATFDAIVPAALRKPRMRKIIYVHPTGVATDKPLTAKQQALIDVLGGEPMRRDRLLATKAAGASVLKKLLNDGVLLQLTRLEPAPPPRLELLPVAELARAPEDAFRLTPGQQAALDALETARAADAFRVCVLFGVPGSGKTEIYVRAIRAVIRAGKQAIVLVPEIALATQVVDRLARRFERVAVFHSRLKLAERLRTIRRIAAGQIDVVIGTRTAVFAACPRLGLIVVDEEQETSFKNLTAPYYHARDVAIKRAQLERIPVVLGSATPALETWHNARNLPHYELLRLPDRVPGARLPQTRLINTSQRADDLFNVLSPELTRALGETLESGEQAVLLHNRRGYAANLRCTACGLVVSCQRCGAALVYHRSDQLMKCHRCGRRSDLPAYCLDNTCRGKLVRTGLAIQRLEEELRRRFAKARLLRLDSDTMRRREDYRAALLKFEERRADILLGTQMVAKGLDFPAVRLVGVIDADAILWMPDFRASEHVFQLIVQVVGRAGRREGESLALIQSAEVEPAAIRHAVKMDYEAFAEAELTIRERLNDPPFSRIVRLILADVRPGRARDEAQRLAESLRVPAERTHAGIRISEAEPCIIPRLREMFRWQVLVRCPRDGSAQRLLRDAYADKRLSPKVKRFTVDVDPFDML